MSSVVPKLPERFLRRLRGGGIRWLARAVFDRVWRPRLAMGRTVLAAVREHRGLEIGGPSQAFGRRGLAAVYRHAAAIDNVNFAPDTAWESALRQGGPFVFDARRAPGRQWICEARTLSGIADSPYDFVLSSHVLEHLANPLGALREWHRVTRAGGHLFIIVPDSARSFDHRRPITTLAHLQNDEAHDTAEDDRSHISEVLSLHDLGRDPGAGTAEEFRARTQCNAQYRCMHHHVFDLALLNAALAATGWRVLASEKARPVHLVAFARKEGE